MAVRHRLVWDHAAQEGVPYSLVYEIPYMATLPDLPRDYRDYVNFQMKHPIISALQVKTLTKKAQANP